MKARRSSLLGCSHYVRPGALIVRVDGIWICAPCRFAQMRELTDIMTTPPKPSGRGAEPDLAAGSAQ